MATKEIIVTERTVQANGQSRAGNAWTLYAIKATTPDGGVIGEQLKSFHSLPTGQAITVDVERQQHPQYGVTYMLKPVSIQEQLIRLVDALTTRVGELEELVGTLLPRLQALEKPEAQPA